MIIIASGKTRADIAKDLSLSPKTISTYRARVMEKMHLKTDADLTNYVLQHQLL
jgi:two-component system invasion response regulator UvrY